MNTNLTPQQFRKAADIQERIEELRAHLAELLDGGEVSTGSTRGGKGKRKMSAAGRAAIAAGAKARWAKVKAGKSNGAPSQSGKRKNKMSAAGRAAIAAAVKARWAKAKKAGKSTL